MEIINVTNDNFEGEVKKSKQLVLADFNADWCGPCHMLAPILEEVAKENEKVKIVSINVDDCSELAEEYNVFSIPCLILFKEGKEDKRMVGFRSKEDVEKFIGE